MSMSGVKRMDVKKPAFAGFVLVIVEVFKGHINDRAIRHINFNHDINLLSFRHGQIVRVRGVTPSG
jgi:hypothetical protein